MSLECMIMENKGPNENEFKMSDKKFPPPPMTPDLQKGYTRSGRGNPNNIFGGQYYNEYYMHGTSNDAKNLKQSKEN